MGEPSYGISDLVLKDLIWTTLTRQEDDRLRASGHGEEHLGKSLGSYKTTFASLYDQVRARCGSHCSVSIHRVMNLVIMLASEKGLMFNQSGLHDFEIRGLNS